MNHANNTGRDTATEVADGDDRVLLEVAGAVGYVGRHYRPGLTVWDALEEAIRWWTADYLTPTDGFTNEAMLELPWNDPDPLRSSIERLLTVIGPAETPDGHNLPDVFTAALDNWVQQMAEIFNDGYRFAFPIRPGQVLDQPNLRLPERQ